MDPVSEQNILPVKLFSKSYTPFKKSSDVPIILIHGLFASHRTWNSIKGKLGDQTKRTVIAYDLRNHGKSEYCEENILDIDADVADLKKLMDDRKIQSAILVAHSIGAKIAMTFALKYVNRVKMLIVVDMCLTFTDNMMKSFRTMASMVKQGSKIFKTFPSNCSEEEAQKMIIKLVLDKFPEASYDSSNFQMLAPIHKNYKTNEIIWDINLNMCTVMETKDSIYTIDTEMNEPYNGNTLFISHEKSNFALKHDKELIQKLFPNSHIQNFEKGFHAFHQENSELFLNIVCNFINSNN